MKGEAGYARKTSTSSFFAVSRRFGRREHGGGAGEMKLNGSPFRQRTVSTAVKKRVWTSGTGCVLASFLLDEDDSKEGNALLGNAFDPLSLDEMRSGGKFVFVKV